MPLLMLDLDNTLIDRDAAFRAAADAFLADHGLPATDLAWLTTLDASGYTPREEVARVIIERYAGNGSYGEYGTEGLGAAVHTLLDGGAADRVTLSEATRDALREAVSAGWTCVIVSNGRVAQQETKIRRTGLDRLVQGWVISEAVGRKKPAPEIFHAAADSVGASLNDAWMIGDSAHADVLGASGVGVPSVWVSGGRSWTEAAYGPTRIAPDTATAVRHLLTP